MQLNKNILDDLFQDNMVLPAFKSVKIGGQVSPNTEVKVKFRNKDYSTTSNSTGLWQIILDPVTDTTINEKLEVAADNQKQIISNIKFGKVFLLSGQSNIEFRLKDEAGYSKLLETFSKKDYENLYYYNVPQIDYISEDGTIKPNDLKNEVWHSFTDKSSLSGVSAIGFYMLVQLKKYYNMPLAIVDDFKGGTSASAWVPLEKLEEDSELNEAFIMPYKQNISGKTWADFDRETVIYNQTVQKHNADLAAYMAKHPQTSLSNAKNIVGHTPWPPPDRPDLFTRPGGLYQTMVSQVRFGTFNAMVWYQGENDTDRPDHYHELLLLLIDTWRKELNDISLPVYLIQLPGYADYPENAEVKIRQVQLDIARTVPGVHLVSFVDGGEAHNIHPTHKAEMGYRLGRTISGMHYTSTPFVYHYDFKNNELILHIAACQKVILHGTTYLEIISTNDSKEKLKLSAKKIIDNNITVDISHFDKVKEVRYLYANFPENIGLYNELGDPISPFRIKL